MHRFVLDSLKAVSILLFSSVLIISCAGTNSADKKNYFEGFSEITKGQSVTLSWDLLKAKSVTIDSINVTFNAKDSVIVSPTKSTKYFFNIEDDKFKRTKTWVVYVKDVTAKKSKFAFQNKAQKSETIKDLAKSKTTDKKATESTKKNITFHAVSDAKKPEVITTQTLNVNDKKKYKKYTPSYQESSYFKGILEKKDLQNPRQIKVMRTEFTDYKKDTLKVQALILDEFGNFLPGLSHEVLDGSLSIVHHCTMGIFNDKVESYTESEHFDLSPFVDLAICFDNSAAAEGNKDLLRVINTVIPQLPHNNRIMMSYFNHDYNRLFALQKIGTKDFQFNYGSIPAPNGLNASYMAIDKALGDMTSLVSNNKKALIMIIHGTDNASILFDFKNLAESAKRYKLPIYTVAVGNGINSFALKYLSSISGGKYYEISLEDPDELKDIIKEITFAQKAYYEFKIPLSAVDDDECRKLKSELIFDTGINTVSDVLRIFRKDTKMPKIPKSLTAFANKGTDIDSLYFKNIDKISKILFDNPEYHIELIGHSGIEGSDEQNNKLSVMRSQKVRNNMILNGVDPEQISTRAAGSNKPLYFMQQADWQELYNRRVEIRWMNPEDKPYEIICGKSDNEEDAISQVEKWEGMGYSCYYERYLKRNIPMYIVKLWGYSTQEQAEATANNLKKKFRSDFFVE